MSVTGAMENWGLVTYRETALLIDSAHSSSAAKQWVALVVGHELAHQWFGNLVTMVTIYLFVQFVLYRAYGNVGVSVEHCFTQIEVCCID